MHAYCVAFAREVIDGEKYHSADRTIILSNEICDEVDDVDDILDVPTIQFSLDKIFRGEF